MKIIRNLGESNGAKHFLWGELANFWLRWRTSPKPFCLENVPKQRCFQAILVTTVSRFKIELEKKTLQNMTQYDQILGVKIREKEKIARVTRNLNFFIFLISLLKFERNRSKKIT